MPDSEEDDQDVLKVASEIERYLQGKGQVADTLEGIAQWWLLRQRLQEEKQRVEKAVCYLCHKGLVGERTLPDGTVLYISKSTDEKGGSSSK